ncbi:MAG TPA: hypothetical protein VFA46_21905 [Actinomycetes bacterium]|nr:hypothetical protein [Actinomycetes bacterium]
MSGSAGLVVNPDAARDVRRLTSLARTIDLHERVHTTSRILLGLEAAGVRRVLYMPEPARVVERALEVLAAAGFWLDLRTRPEVQPVHLPCGVAVDAHGTAAAAAAMAAAGVSCVVTVGGDGTNRAVAIGWPGSVLVPLPGGTNNAFALPAEPTAAGLAVGVYAADPERYRELIHPAGRLEVRLEAGSSTVALVDVAVVRGVWVGARAVWEPETLVEVVLARADPLVSGLAGLGGMLHPLDGCVDRVLHVRLGRPGRAVLAQLGPGRIEAVAVRDWRLVGGGRAVTLSPGPVTVALDGEREFVLERGCQAEVRLVPGGPWLLDVRALLERAARDGRFRARPPP